MILGGIEFTQPIPKDKDADQLCRVPIIGQPPRDKTRSLEW